MDEATRVGVVTWLRKLREEDGATQSDVSDALGISLRTYQRWEAAPQELRAWQVARCLAELDPDGLYELAIVPKPEHAGGGVGWVLSMRFQARLL